MREAIPPHEIDLGCHNQRVVLDDIASLHRASDGDKLGSGGYDCHPRPAVYPHVDDARKQQSPPNRPGAGYVRRATPAAWRQYPRPAGARAARASARPECGWRTAGEGRMQSAVLIQGLDILNRDDRICPIRQWIPGIHVQSLLAIMQSDWGGWHRPVCILPARLQNRPSPRHGNEGMK